MYGILLAADEVICAFGRMGHWFASERLGIDNEQYFQDHLDEIMERMVQILERTEAWMDGGH